jgi:hypothetical protein
MHIFLSYASEDRQLAEEISLALLGSSHTVFFDKASLPPGGDYHARIDAAVRKSDLFIFLISPNSVAQGSYALTELKFARSKWPHPKNRLLPVRLHGTVWEAIPPYLRSVTVLEPEGSAPAEIVAAVANLDISNSSGASSSNSKVVEDHKKQSDPKTKNAHKSLFWIATIALIVAVGGALFLSLPVKKDRDANQAINRGKTGTDAGIKKSQPLIDDCFDVTETDYSKSPPESKIVRRCPPQQ